MYRCVNIVGFLADCTPLLELYAGFWLAYLIPCCAMVVSLAPIVLCRGIFGKYWTLILQNIRIDLFIYNSSGDAKQ